MKIRYQETIGKIKRLFWAVILIEIFLGGSGRLMELNPTFTVRMLLFSIALLCSLFVLLLDRSISKKIFVAVVITLSIIFLPTAISIINGGSSLMFDDVKPLIFFLLIIFFSKTIKNECDIILLKKIIIICAVILAIFHVFVYLFLQLNFYDMKQLWYTLSYLNSHDDSPKGGEGEFFFKGHYGFIYYKSDLYMCIGLLCVIDLLSNTANRRYLIILLSCGIFLTGTRGFILAFVLTITITWLMEKKDLKSYIIAILGFIFGGLIIYLIKPYIGDKDESDLIRYLQFNQVLDQTTLLSIIWGHGYGFGVPIRPGHMEIAYLEIFHKQGIVGMILWLYLLFTIYTTYKAIGTTGQFFWQSSLFVYILSFTNPYINHPLGITTLIISIVCLDVLYNRNRFSRLNNERS